MGSRERWGECKVLPPELADADPSFAARFEREAKSMARLEHPNIVHEDCRGRYREGPPLHKQCNTHQ
ncbi:MAG: hypothetical protein ACKVLL_15505 [Verrucomicrobiales bacterium]